MASPTRRSPTDYIRSLLRDSGKRSRIEYQSVEQRAGYWESRAPELIATYDDPQRWPALGWNIQESNEETVVPDLLQAVDARSVLVVGSGSGRQYRYLLEAGISEVSGIDISPSMVAECRRRFPTVNTQLGSIVGCEGLCGSVDATLSVTVLQHIPESEISQAILSLQAATRKIVILLEFTEFENPPPYIYPRDYGPLFEAWRPLYRGLVREGTAERTELMAWEKVE